VYQGILPHNENTTAFEEYVGYCHDANKIEAVHKCTPALKTKEITDHINDKCKNKKAC
jgi:hypothetical protein